MSRNMLVLSSAPPKYVSRRTAPVACRAADAINLFVTALCSQWSVPPMKGQLARPRGASIV